MGMSQLRPHYRGYKSAGNLSDMRSSAELFRSARGKLLIDVKRSLTERRSQIRLPAAKRSGERKIREVRKPGCTPGFLTFRRDAASNCIRCGIPLRYFCISRFVCGAVLATVVSRQPSYCFRTGSSCFSGKQCFCLERFFR